MSNQGVICDWLQLRLLWNGAFEPVILIVPHMLDKECYKSARSTYSVFLMIFHLYFFTFTLCPWTAWCEKVSPHLFREKKSTTAIAVELKFVLLEQGCKAGMGRSLPKTAALHTHQLCGSATFLLTNSLHCSSAHAGSPPASQNPHPTPCPPWAASAWYQHCYI